MGKEIRVICDKCGNDVYGEEYYTISPHRVLQGKRMRQPTIWFCMECAIKAGILINGERKEQE